MERRTYILKVQVNERWFNRVIIDPHYEENHSESIDDELVLSLVRLMEVHPDEDFIGIRTAYRRQNDKMAK